MDRALLGEAALSQRVPLRCCCLLESGSAGDFWSLLLPLKQGKALFRTTISQTSAEVSQKRALRLLPCSCSPSVAPIASLPVGFAKFNVNVLTCHAQKAL